MSGMWKLQDAKNRLSEVIEEARQHSPQVITRRGTAAAIVLSYED
jgi:antitoxin Phd